MPLFARVFLWYKESAPHQNFLFNIDYYFHHNRKVSTSIESGIFFWQTGIVEVMQMIKAVIFDMHETLITLFDSPLYFGTQMAIDAGIEEEKF